MEMLPMSRALTVQLVQLFEKLTDEELKEDLCYSLIQNSSEEASKVSRNEGSKWSAVYRRLSVEKAIQQAAGTQA